MPNPLTRAVTLRVWAPALVLWSALLGATALRYRAPEPLPENAPEEVFSAGRATRALEALLELGPRPTGSEANARARAWLESELVARGWVPERQPAHVCGRYGRCADVVNVVARRPGREAPTAIALVAHYDTVPDSPGASDNGAGVVALLEIARLLARESSSGLRHEVVLLFTDGEELGLLGAEAFVRSHPLRERVRRVVNLEARGASGPSILFRTSGEGALPLVRAFGAEAPRPVTNSVAHTVFSLLPNDTDLTVFLEQGWLGLDFAYIGDPLRYHTPDDDLAHLDRGSLQHHGDNAWAALRGLARAPPEERGAGAVWTDVLALTVVAIDVTWARVLFALALLGLVGLAVTRRRRLSLGGLVRALVALVAALVAAAGLGLALASLTTPAGPWAEQPAPVIVGAHVAGGLAFALAAWVARRASSEEVALVTGLVYALGAVALAWSLPGASYVLGAPALAMLVALLVAMPAAALTRLDGERVGLAAAYAGTSVAALVLFPFGVLLYDALGHLAVAAIALTFVLALAPGLALAGGGRGRARS